ncbi:FliA/WhiG family RNA polymerase sigma factor [Halanaerobaculum tunisiense]
MVENLAEEELWNQYQEQNSQAAKEELIMRYIPLVKHIVSRIMIAIPDKFSFEDLVNYGVLGLIDAMQRFDPGRGIKFSTYAVPRVKGSIYDQLRESDWVPTSIRRKAKEFSRKLMELENKLGYSPTDQELREELNLSQVEYNDLLSQINIPENVSLEKTIAQQDGDQLKIKDLIRSSSEQEPDYVYDYRQMKKILGQAIEKLPDKEKLVVSLYYHDDLTLQEIGEVMDLTAARISQLHTKAIFRLRGYLSHQKEVLVG